MKIALVHDRVRWEEKQLVRAAAELHVELELLNLDKSFFTFDEEFEFDVALQRSISYFRALHSTAIMERSNVRVYESLETLQVCGNKLFTSLALHDSGVPTPKTGVGFSKENVLENIEYPAVLKPVIGSWGRLVSALNDKESATSILEHREQMGALYNTYYVQERVDTGGKDIRAFVVGGEVIGAAYRRAPEDGWRSNVAIGGRVENCDLTGELEKNSLDAAQAVGGKIVSVDLFETENGLLVNEVNSTPEFRGLSTATGIDVAQKILGFVKEEYHG